MVIKLGNNIVNLDLVKEITPIEATIHTKGKIGGEYHYTDVEPEHEARWIEIVTEEQNENTPKSRKYYLEYGFKILYLEEKYPRRVLFSTKEKAIKGREKFAELLNGNNPVIHVIDID